MRLRYGLERLPAGLGPEDERLPGIMLGPKPLRLSSEPMPPSFFPQQDDSRAVRIRALTDWLSAACGDYAPLRRRFVALYLGFAAAHIERHRTTLNEKLRRFDGLYRPEDFLWSALRPLPRAWVPTGETHVAVDFAFWDGWQLAAVMIGEERRQSDAMLTAAGVSLHRVSTADLGGDPEIVIEKSLPASVLKFWGDEVLPTSPFRRTIA
jgi:hypothetical protein